MRINKNNINLCTNSGQSLMEVIIALAVTAIILTGIVSLTSKSVSTSTYSKNKSQANRHASEAMEYVRTQKEQLGWTDFKTLITTPDPDVWCMKTLEFTMSGVCPADDTGKITGTIFQRTLEVKNVLSKTMDVEVKVVWSDEKGTHETYTISSISNWQL